MSVPLVVQTLFRHRVDAEAESVRRQALYDSRRRFSAKVKMTPEVAAILNLGITVTIEDPRLGLAACRNVRVFGIDGDLIAQIATLTLWG
jgi:hypothetical protein